MVAGRSSRCGHEALQSQHSSQQNALQAQDRHSTESGSEDEHSAINVRYLSLLPTERDMESMFHQMEDSHKSNMAELNKSLQSCL